MTTALALMRSRFDAFVRHDIDYLVATHHPDTRPHDLVSQLRESLPHITYTSLEIVRTSMGEEYDKIGKVEFKAHYLHDGEAGVHHELSRFKRYKGAWCYLDGEVY
ncbi:MAG: hypothetical protein KU37_08975 [Sulfuricurvum sp. PC08-66]|nr:MAG: hypothetical protein KU37_08975 [Sulfuricurvum sp. PC08-66]